MLTPDEVTRLIGSRRLKHFRDLELVGSNIYIQDSADPIPTLGYFSTVPSSPKNKTPIPRSKKLFHKDHCDIGYGDVPGYGGFKYVIKHSPALRGNKRNIWH